VVVRCARTPGFQQFPYGGHGRYEDRFLVDALPDLVKSGQPVEKPGILHRRYISRQDLVEVVVGVDEAGNHDTIRTVDNFHDFRFRIFNIYIFRDTPD
jgi:hypothetical protein